MDRRTYALILEQLGLTHREIAERLGVKTWTSEAWRSGLRSIPDTIAVAVRALLFEHLAPPAVVRKVNAAFAEIEARAMEAGEPERLRTGHKPARQKREGRGLRAMIAELERSEGKSPRTAQPPRTAKATAPRETEPARRGLDPELEAEIEAVQKLARDFLERYADRVKGETS